jgi:hypothetical protein
VAFSTYIGGSDFEQIRDITTDGQGNIYVTGGTGSADFPTTLGSAHNGWFDIFIVKLDSAGRRVWSRLLGGPNYDRAYAIKVDSQGNIYLTGRAGPGFPTTAGSLQPTFNGYDTGAAYGKQNAFVAKLDPSGNVLWATYFGTAGYNRDMAIDPDGDVYLASNYEPVGGQAVPPSSWFTNGYQKTPQGGSDMVVAKLKGDGKQVLWATYLGGSGDESGKNSIALDSTGHIYILSDTRSTDIPTPNGFQTTNHGSGDFYLAKLSPNSSNLVWATYFGGSGPDWCETHHIALDSQDNVFIGGITSSNDLPTTAGVVQPSYGGDNGRVYFHATGDAYVAKFSVTGQLLASTYVGGRYGDGGQGMGVDAVGNVYFTGGTVSDNFPVTSNAFQPTFKGVEDVIAVKLSGDLTQLLYATYLGSSADDEGRVLSVDPNGTFYVAGQSAGTDYPRAKALQGTYGGGTGDNIVTQFTLHSKQ